MGRVPILQHFLVARQQGELFDPRLCQQYPIKRIGVNLRQGADFQHMRRSDGKFAETRPNRLFSQANRVHREITSTEAALDDDFPDICNADQNVMFRIPKNVARGRTQRG